jgi:cytochrome c1
MFLSWFVRVFECSIGCVSTLSRTKPSLDLSRSPNASLSLQRGAKTVKTTKHSCHAAHLMSVTPAALMWIEQKQQNKLSNIRQSTTDRKQRNKTSKEVNIQRETQANRGPNTETSNIHKTESDRQRVTRAGYRRRLLRRLRKYAPRR